MLGATHLFLSLTFSPCSLPLIKNSDPLVWGGAQAEVFIVKISSVILSTAACVSLQFLVPCCSEWHVHQQQQHCWLEMQGVRPCPRPSESEHALEQNPGDRVLIGVEEAHSSWVVCVCFPFCNRCVLGSGV